MNKLAIIFVITFTVLGSGCAEIARNMNESYAQANDPNAYYQPIDISGDWRRSDGGYNRFQKTYDGYYVTAVGRGSGKGVHYIEIGDHLYQDANGSGTYEVVAYNQLVWRKNNTVIKLYRGR